MPHRDDAKNERGFLCSDTQRKQAAVSFGQDIRNLSGKRNAKAAGIRPGTYERGRLIKRAGFPTYKTFEDYSYQSVKFPPAFCREELEALEFVPEKKNLVLYGPVGVGKTHMAIAVGVKACNLGYKTKFYTVTELVLKLAEARKNGTLERLLRDLRSLDLLILDEWGYVPVDKDGSQLLFRVISDSYESKSLILTTNLEFSKWGGIFTDDQMAAAMIDRLVHHGHLLIFEGKSYRMEHALMRRDA